MGLRLCSVGGSAPPTPPQKQGPRFAGLTAQARARREQVRFAIGEMFAAGASNRQVAEHFRVSPISANRWHWAFDQGGKKCKLTGPQVICAGGR
jgi:hypothetical protein